MIRCRTCNKEFEQILPDGIYQVGQGAKKPFLTFCNEKCLKRYEDYKERKILWKLKGINPIRNSKLSRNNSQVKKGEDVAVHRLSPGATKQLGGRHKKQQQMTEVADNQPDNVPIIKRKGIKK